MSATLQRIYNYPVKSFAGYHVKHADIHPEGMAQDRRWLITDHQGRFLTARRYPRMLLWQAYCDNQHNLTLTSPNGSRRHIPTQQCANPRRVTVWKDTFTAYTAPDSTNTWLSDELGTPCLLHYLGAHSRRPLKHSDGNLTFADSSPYLLTTQASLTELNRRLSQPISMTRFRPNIVISGDIKAWAEDGWRDIRIGEVNFRFYAPCTRCTIINIDPTNGTISRNNQPLKTLQETHFSSKEPVFGIHLIAKNSGTVHQGCRVHILT